MTRARWLSLAILLVATALRFYRAGEMSLRADEATSLLLARQDPQAIVRVFITSDPHMPLYFLILHFWMLAVGISELAVRFPAIFVGVLSVALTYALGKQLFPRRRQIALLGAALIALNPFLIWDAQDVYMYSALTAMTLVSFNLFLRLESGARRSHWVAYIVASAVGLYFHYFFAFILLAQGILWMVWIVTRQIDFRTTIRFALAASAVVILFLPWVSVAFPLLTTFHSDFIPASSLLEMCQRALVTFTVGRTDTRMAPAWVDPTIGIWLSLGFLAIFLYGAFARNATEGAARIALAIFLGAPMGAFFAYSLVRFPLFDERYILYISAAFSLMVARGLTNFWDVPGRRWIALAAAAFILLADGYALNNYFHVPEFARSPDWRTFVQTLDDQAQPGDVVLQNYPDPALPYYLQDRVPRVLLPRSSFATAAEIDADMQRVTTKYARVWFQAAPYSTWDTEGLVEMWLRRHARQISVIEPRGLRLVLYAPASIALREAQPVDATLAGQIRLRAFDCDARAANVFRVTLYWHALARPARAATVFVHLYDADGKLWSQQDNAPVNGTYPTLEWQADQVIVDEYVLVLPADAPAGKYFVHIGMYDSQTHERLIVLDAHGKAFPQNRVPLCEVAR
ncbi:MAG: hypothetical protein FJ009_15755 [Chloroflexi bacterium]|nr:hypothetical protein [Chloroflexota bacterium]